MLLMLLYPAGYCRKCHTAGHTTEDCRAKRCTICHTKEHDTEDCPKQQSLSRGPSGQLPLPWDVPAALQELQEQQQQLDEAQEAMPQEQADDQISGLPDDTASHLTWTGEVQPWDQQQELPGKPERSFDILAMSEQHTATDAESMHDQECAEHPPGSPAADQASWGAGPNVGQAGTTGPVSTEAALSPRTQAQLQLQPRDESQELLPLKLLLPQHAADLEAALPAGMLPQDWASFPTWHELEQAMHWVVKGMTRTQPRKVYQAAKLRAQEASAAVLGPAQVQSPAPARKAAAKEPADAPGAAGSQAAAGPAPGSSAWKAALQQLLSCSSDVKWRAILPSGDRVGPFSASELAGWLGGGGGRGRAPKGVGSAEAREVEADQGALQLCAISAKDYNPQKLPGECRCLWCHTLQ